MPSSKIDPSPYLSDGSRPICLRDFPTRVESPVSGKKPEKVLETIREEIDGLQQKLYAQDRYAMLCIFQAMDAAGKDGAIRAVFSGVNPHGIEVSAFKTPSAEELDHTFFWRTDRVMPARGRIGIFNRSYYEEVLIARVHPEIVTHGQHLPAEFTQDLNLLWTERYETIRSMERSHHRNGTRIHKFFLHLSRDEQRKRFLSRLDSPSKNWKFNEGDLKERKLWDRYMEAYEAAIAATSTPDSPWYIIPADDKTTARLLIATIVKDALKALPISFPKLTDEQIANLGSYRKLLEKGD